MQQRVIVNELHVTRLKLHAKMKMFVVSQGIEQIERLDISRRQSQRIGKALRAVDVLALIEAREEALVPA